MTKNASRKKAIRSIMAMFNTNYTTAMQINDGGRCAFCLTILRRDKDDGLLPSNGEVGEFWSKTLQNSVLAHPDCTPLGIDAIQEGKDPEWSMA